MDNKISHMINNNYIDIPLNAFWEAIATRLSLSSSTIPQYYVTIKVKMNPLLEMKNKI